MSVSRYTLIAVLLSALLSFSACSSSDDDTDGDIDGDMAEDAVDGDEETSEAGEDSEEEITNPFADSPVFGGPAVFPKRGGVVLTESSYDSEGNAGDGSWKTVEDYTADDVETNIGLSVYGFELGYGDLSKHVSYAVNRNGLPGDNGGLVYLGPFNEREQIDVEEKNYYYFKIADGPKLYYLRFWVELDGVEGLQGEYLLSENAAFGL